MKQVVQNLKSGAIGVEEVPAPSATRGLGAPGVLVATACSLISPGTERAAVELGRLQRQLQIHGARRDTAEHDSEGQKGLHVERFLDRLEA